MAFKPYIVKSGGSLKAICKENGIDYGSAYRIILSLNGIDNPNEIYIGQTILCNSEPFDVSHLAYDEIFGSAEIKTKTKRRIQTILKSQGRTWDGMPIPKLKVTDLRRERLTEEETKVDDAILMKKVL